MYRPRTGLEKFWVDTLVVFAIAILLVYFGLKRLFKSIGYIFSPVISGGKYICYRLMPWGVR